MIKKIPGKSDMYALIVFAIMFLIDFAESLTKKLEDKKLSWGERFDLLIHLKPLLEIIKNWREMTDEIKLLQNDENEMDNIVLLIKSELDLPNEKIKERVVKACDLLLTLYSFIGSF